MYLKEKEKGTFSPFHYLLQHGKHLHAFALLDGYFWCSRRIALHEPDLSYQQS